MSNNQGVALTELGLKATLAKEHLKTIENYLGSPEKALEFMSNVVESVRRNPALLECVPATVISSFIVMASLKLMPSGVSGEAFVLPYKNKGRMEAQFQLGYQGIITLLYRAGAKSVVAELVREKDSFELVNGKVLHKVNPLKSRADRGEVIGAYAIITNSSGGTVESFMRMEDIHSHAKRFSKSYGGDYSPWNASSDPEGWMPRKTVLKQAAKLAPKNEYLSRAIAEDNKDSVIGDRLDAAKESGKSLTMGSLALEHGKSTEEINAEAQAKSGEESQDGPHTTEGSQDGGESGERVIEG